MSVEQFFLANPVGNNLLADYADKVKPENTVKALFNFVDQMAQAGRAKIIVLSEEISGGSGVVDISPELLSRLGSLGQKDFSAILLSSLVPTIHEMLVDQKFSLESLISRVNHYLVGTRLGSIVLAESEKGKEDIPFEQWKVMLREGQEDRTMVRLIRHHEIWPPRLQRFFYQTGLFQTVELVLPDYEIRARMIVGQESSGAS